MSLKKIPLEQRMKENIKNYGLEILFSNEILTEQLVTLADQYELQLLIVDRRGKRVLEHGEFSEFNPDVSKNPGLKLRVWNRTLGHIYVKNMDQSEFVNGKALLALVERIHFLEMYGEEVYLHREYAIYAQELESISFSEFSLMKTDNLKQDELTGVLRKNYLQQKLKVLERAQMVPVGVICANINDWKYARDQFGEEESNRLIQIIVSIIIEESKPEYIIGRVEEDAFQIFIPLAEEGEVADYCKRVQTRCGSYEDDFLAPSIAMGFSEKKNVEETLNNIISDAEYEMLQDKYNLKHEAGYIERLHHRNMTEKEI